ncbi:MAG: TonB-dependent receptor, partial [Hydrogenophilaceae bacterium]
LRRREDEMNCALRLDHARGAHLLAGSLELLKHARRDDQTLVASTIYRAEERQWTAWLQDEWTPVGNLTVTGGLRGEAVRLEADGAARSYHRLSPSLALRWEAGEGWIVRSSLGTGLKPPTLDELNAAPVTSLSANTPLEPDRRGNPDLRPERSLNFEAALERYLPGKAGVLGANLYWRATRDFVEHRVQLEGSRWVDRPYNEGDARHWGLELDAKLKTDAWGPKGGNLRGHLTLPRSEVDDARLGLTRPARETPTYQLTLGYDQSLPAWQASAGFQVQHYGRVKTDIPDEQWAETGPRSVLDLYVTRRLTRDLNLRLNVQNLFQGDTDQSSRAWSGTDAWSLDGSDFGKRRVMLTLEGKW